MERREQSEEEPLAPGGRMSVNRELVVFYIKYKLSLRGYPLHHIGLLASPNQRTDAGSGQGEEQQAATHINGTVNGTSAGEPPASSQEQQQQPAEAAASSLDVIKEALQCSANEFELRYAQAFSDLHHQLHITPATAYQSFENVMDEVFRDGVNWGRVVGLFAFGGALCVECVEKEMSPLVVRIMEWMTVYLDNQIQPWIQSQGGWVSVPHQPHEVTSCTFPPTPPTHTHSGNFESSCYWSACFC